MLPGETPLEESARWSRLLGGDNPNRPILRGNPLRRNPGAVRVSEFPWEGGKGGKEAQLSRMR